jgi:hypothetical protein
MRQLYVYRNTNYKKIVLHALSLASEIICVSIDRSKDVTLFSFKLVTDTAKYKKEYLVSDIHAMFTNDIGSICKYFDSMVESLNEHRKS